MNATTIDGVTPLFNACSRGSAACAELLLEYGAKAQWETCLPSPTHEAASRGKKFSAWISVKQLMSVSIILSRNVPSFLSEAAYWSQANPIMLCTDRSQWMSGSTDILGHRCWPWSSSFGNTSVCSMCFTADPLYSKASLCRYVML